MTESATESRTGEITKEIVRLNESKESLHNRIGVLVDRLKDVMGQPEPKPTVAENVKETLSCPFAIDLSSVSGTIETDLDKINDILDRLEL